MHRISLTLFLALVLALPATLGLTSNAQAATARGTNSFGAIAVNPHDGAFGYSFNYRARGAAEDRALRECRIRSDVRGCRGIVWVRNGCAAVSVRRRTDGSLSRITWGIGGSREQAQRRAKAKCQEDGRRCVILAWVCSTR